MISDVLDRLSVMANASALKYWLSEYQLKCIIIVNHALKISY